MNSARSTVIACGSSFEAAWEHLRVFLLCPYVPPDVFKTDCSIKHLIARILVIDLLAGQRPLPPASYVMSFEYSF